jgi:hypothetical protein
MNDSTDLRIPSLEMKGGLEADVRYPAKYMHAPESQHPSKAPSSGKEMPKGTECMRITMGR